MTHCPHCGRKLADEPDPPRKPDPPPAPVRPPPKKDDYDEWYKENGPVIGNG